MTNQSDSKDQEKLTKAYKKMLKAYKEYKELLIDGKIYKLPSNPIDAFWNERVEIDKNSWVSKSLLYKSYGLWCDLRQVIPVSNSKFSRCVNMYLHQENDFRPLGDDGRQVDAWKGIKVRDL